MVRGASREAARRTRVLPVSGRMDIQSEGVSQGLGGACANYASRGCCSNLLIKVVVFVKVEISTAVIIEATLALGLGQSLAQPCRMEAEQDPRAWLLTTLLAMPASRCQTSRRAGGSPTTRACSPCRREPCP